VSIHAMIAAAYLEDLEPSTRLILMATADSCDEQTRVAAPGLPKLRAWSGLSKSQVLKIIAKLETDGLLTQTAKGNRGRRAEWRVFPNGVPAIPHPDEVAARYETPSTPVDNPVELGSVDATLLDAKGRVDPSNGSHPSDPFSTSTSVSSARRETPSPSRPVDRRPTSSAPSPGFPGARAATEEDRAIARRARGAHNVACHIEAHAAAGEIVPCGRCAHAAANSDPAKIAEAKALIRASLRGAS
jgi:hypothetical protein